MGGKVDHRRLTKKELSDLQEHFIAALACCRGKRDLGKFIQDILTKSEKVMLGRRIQIAKRLLAGQSPHRIRTDLKIGFATIAFVEAWLSESMPRYRALLLIDEK